MTWDLVMNVFPDTKLEPGDITNALKEINVGITESLLKIMVLTEL